MPRGPDIQFGGKKAQDHKKNLKRRHGMTVVQFQAMFRVQDGLCAICHRRIYSCRGFNKIDSACVDHDHATGKTRALLCRGCNSGLGQFYDNPNFLRRAAVYLEYHQK